MEVQPNGSGSGHQHWGAELSEMLEVVVLPEMSGVHEQCIYIVPQNLRQVNPNAYTPQVVSIGPLHNPRGSGEENNMLKPMEDLKLKYLKGFLKRTELCVPHILLAIDKAFNLGEWENGIRSCYAGPINYNSNDFLKMIIIDSCFIIEHFLRCYSLSEWMEKDPFLINHSLCNDIVKDLILLENQLPFFVLEDIYNLAGLNPSFVTITFDYFEKFNKQKIDPEGVVSPKHFTDLLRTFLLPSSSFDLGQEETVHEIKQVYSASQLSEAGLLFEVSEDNKCLLDLKFEKGVLTMPCFLVHDSTERHLRNILAFEECHLLNSAYISQYLAILDSLINTEKDVSILVDKKIIVNLMGDTNSVVTMVNNLSNNLSMPDFNSKYRSVCNSLNGFYENPLNKYKAIFIHEYFNTPVKIASTIAATLLLSLTLIQTIFSVCSYFKE